MPLKYEGFDHEYDLLFDDLWRFCFLMTGNMKAAQDLAFRSFLVLGSTENANSTNTSAAKSIVWSAATELIQHYYTQKMRHPVSRKSIECQELPFPVDDRMLTYMRQSINIRFASLLCYAGFTVHESSVMLHRTERAISRNLTRFVESSVEDVWNMV